MNFVKRFGLLCVIAVDASHGAGVWRDGLRRRRTSTIELTGTRTTTPGVYGDVAIENTPPDELELETTQPLEATAVQRLTDQFNRFTNRVGPAVDRQADRGGLLGTVRMWLTGRIPYAPMQLRYSARVRDVDHAALTNQPLTDPWKSLLIYAIQRPKPFPKPLSGSISSIPNPGT